ncbi:prepilin-type N-terminal cleavage/methylation domain-containing protein [Patescibacteria group bacterium]|nr:prepilin-type N-terminal cleavage/methylation domain-containing protein [Patescibacteria group bacterium]
MKLKNKGFTIIELMVVVAIIGILAALITISFSDAKAKSRDSRRMEDLKSLSNALNLFYANFHRFPISAGAIDLDGTASDTVSNDLISNNAAAAPIKDPLSPATDYVYNSTNGLDYTITFCLETNSIKGYIKGCTNTQKP